MQVKILKKYLEENQNKQNLKQTKENPTKTELHKEQLDLVQFVTSAFQWLCS